MQVDADRHLSQELEQAEWYNPPGSSEAQDQSVEGSRRFFSKDQDTSF